MMPVANDFPLGILKRTAEKTAWSRTPGHRGAIDRYSDEAAVIERFVSLRLRKGDCQRLARGLGIEPFGEVSQSIITEVSAHVQRTACLGTHQCFYRMKTAFSQQITDQQRPEQMLCRNLRTGTTVSWTFQVGFQSQALTNIAEDPTWRRSLQPRLSELETPRCSWRAAMQLSFGWG